MWVVESANFLYGPFRSAALAAKWANKELAFVQWKLIQLRKS